MSYDIIGDIHGHSQSLESILTKLGYKNQSGIYRHPSRKVIFLGDFIDRGNYQREVIDIARAMIDSGNALAVMGNHEFNAIAYYTADHEGDGYLRPHSEKNTGQHQAFLDAYQGSPAAYEDTINWFKTLPLWLDLGDLRVIHACWDKHEIAEILKYQDGECYLSEKLLRESCRSGTWQFRAVETILKGKEIPLKPGASFKDKDGNVRHNIRVRWWDREATSYKDAFMGPESARTHIPDDQIEGDHMVEYSHESPPVILGHYWMEGEPVPLAPNIACLDYSVAKPGGKLVAYRWDGEQTLDPGKYVWVERIES
ncbi:MAG: metallophosphoesterase [Candidatus Thiodiazotropha sp. (ex Ctena orbiculata)]|nr:metallophosphoesterase [Candidatus Thiodiazotropha taylori]MBT2996179.1 metallophosphoesterase [Candidatus Thiodiazotropha taylori]MBT2999676.1 metallophosphoesterase [Candidatus Thiodiazotropha taylori]MBV2106320.1 metallophosphoesterase [Candidatus Thiodiazotropha taylori]MBV2110452.1 metallophosphoesterase [Candidatus Thiodiazotropha taylori]